MNIDGVKIYDLEESIVASGLPMLAEYNADDFDECCAFLEIAQIDEYDTTRANHHFKRAVKLANNPVGSGHSNFLSGVLVSANVTATVKWWEQFQRYHFKQIVSSQSTMHRLRKMLREGTAKFNSKTDPEIINRITELAKESDDMVSDEALAYSCPMGLELTARITTNYLQLRTIYQQRKNHKLAEWHTFCNWIKSLPYSAEFITGESK